MTSNILAKNDISTPLCRLRELVSDRLDLVDNLIFDLIKSKVTLIPQISEHTISSGGKRLRPILTLSSAKLSGYSGDADVSLAACVEFIHTATLLHDDVVDKSKLRRGMSTANSLWGNKESVLVGDFLLGKAFELMGAAQSLEVYRILSNAAVIISEGEVLQLEATGSAIQGYENTYFSVINGKTAELFAAACQVGAVIAGSDKAEVAALREYGLNLGVAFQIIDDAIDYSSSTMGKEVGDDFREKKVTMPVMLAYASGTVDEKAFWDRVITEGSQRDGDLEVAIDLIKKYNAIQASVDKAREYIDKSKCAINIFPPTNMQKAMLDILDFVVCRNF